MNRLFLLILAIMLENGMASTKVQVTIADGILEGFEDISSTGKCNYTRFHGIPFAKPPLKGLRFKAPQPAVPWKGVRDATKYSQMCIQKDLTTNKVLGSEDCLYLNVYTPNLKPHKPLAVIFVIPGYLFRTGSGDDDIYGPGFLMEYNVVVVTMNYRLGLFGFLCLDIPEVPGNAALMDQILALKWVQKNIKEFGGDPTKVTVYGQAGGAASASLHYVSPLASGLFARIIITSGVFHCDWSAPFQARRNAFGLGRALGLYTSDPYELLDFLCQLPEQKLVLTDPSVLISDNVTSLLKKNFFTPVREKHFGPGQYMTYNPVDLLLKGKVNKVDIMVGHMEQDGLFNTWQQWDLILDTYPYYFKMYTPNRINNFQSSAETLEYSYAIKKYYFDNEALGPNTVNQFVRMYSYCSILYPLHQWMYSLPTDSSNNRYFFHFFLYTNRNYFSRQTKSLGLYQSTIRDEAAYLFDGKIMRPKLKQYPELWKYVDQMCAFWTDFAKFGNPTPTDKFGIKWPLIGNKANVYTEINNDGLKLVKFNKSTPELQTQQDFWKELHAKANVSFRDSWEYDIRDSSLSTSTLSASCYESCRS